MVAELHNHEFTVLSVYYVKCTVYFLQWTVYKAHLTVYSAQCKVQIVFCNKGSEPTYKLVCPCLLPHSAHSRSNLPKYMSYTTTMHHNTPSNYVPSHFFLFEINQYLEVSLFEQTFLMLLFLHDQNFGLKNTQYWESKNQKLEIQG